MTDDEWKKLLDQHAAHQRAIDQWRDRVDERFNELTQRIQSLERQEAALYKGLHVDMQQQVTRLQDRVTRQQDRPGGRDLIEMLAEVHGIVDEIRTMLKNPK